MTDLPTQDAATDVANPALLLERLEGDVELLREVVGIFLDDCPARLVAVRDAVERHDETALARAAHSLKGGATNFAADRCVQAAHRLEILGRSGDWTQVHQALAILETEVAHLTTALRDLA